MQQPFILDRSARLCLNYNRRLHNVGKSNIELKKLICTLYQFNKSHVNVGETRLWTFNLNA